MNYLSIFNFKNNKQIYLSFIFITLFFITANYMYYHLFLNDYEKKLVNVDIKFDKYFNLKENYYLTDDNIFLNKLVSLEKYEYQLNNDLSRISFVIYSTEDNYIDEIENFVIGILNNFNSRGKLPPSPSNLKYMANCKKIFKDENFCFNYYKPLFISYLNNIQSEFFVNNYILEEFNDLKDLMMFYNTFINVYNMQNENVNILSFTYSDQVYFRLEFINFLFKNLIIYFTFSFLIILTFISFKSYAYKNKLKLL